MHTFLKGSAFTARPLSAERGRARNAERDITRSHDLMILALLGAGALRNDAVRRLRANHGFVWVSYQQLVFSSELPAVVSELDHEERSTLAAAPRRWTPCGVKGG